MTSDYNDDVSSSRKQPAGLAPGDILPKPQKLLRHRSHRCPPTPDLQRHWRVTASQLKDSDPTRLQWHVPDTDNVFTQHSSSSSSEEHVQQACFSPQIVILELTKNYLRRPKCWMMYCKRVARQLIW